MGAVREDIIVGPGLNDPGSLRKKTMTETEIARVKMHCQLIREAIRTFPNPAESVEEQVNKILAVIAEIERGSLK